MGLMWLSGVAIYGMSVQRLGKLGASIGWALIQSTAIIAGNLSGFIAGEWRGTGERAKRTIGWDLSALIVGIVVVGWSAALQLAGFAIVAPLLNVPSGQLPSRVDRQHFARDGARSVG